LIEARVLIGLEPVLISVLVFESVAFLAVSLGVKTAGDWEVAISWFLT